MHDFQYFEKFRESNKYFSNQPEVFSTQIFKKNLFKLPVIKMATNHIMYTGNDGTSNKK